MKKFKMDLSSKRMTYCSTADCGECESCQTNKAHDYYAQQPMRTGEVNDLCVFDTKDLIKELKKRGMGVYPLELPFASRPKPE